MKEVCTNCGNIWLAAYTEAGKCDACGSLDQPHVEPVELEGQNV